MSTRRCHTFVSRSRSHSDSVRHWLLTRNWPPGRPLRQCSAAKLALSSYSTSQRKSRTIKLTLSSRNRSITYLVVDFVGAQGPVVFELGHFGVLLRRQVQKADGLLLEA